MFLNLYLFNNYGFDKSLLKTDIPSRLTFLNVSHFYFDVSSELRIRVNKNVIRKSDSVVICSGIVYVSRDW